MQSSAFGRNCTCTISVYQALRSNGKFVKSSVAESDGFSTFPMKLGVTIRGWTRQSLGRGEARASRRVCCQGEKNSTTGNSKGEVRLRVGNRQLAAFDSEKLRADCFLKAYCDGASRWINRIRFTWLRSICWSAPPIRKTTSVADMDATSPLKTEPSRSSTVSWREVPSS